jgi:hypothetical protein
MKAFNILLLCMLIAGCGFFCRDRVPAPSGAQDSEEISLIKEYDDDYFLIGDDMLIGKDDPQFEGLIKTLRFPHLKSVMRSSVAIWPNGTIPYCFYDDITQGERDTVRAAMDTWESVANLDFIEQNQCEDYLPATEDEEPDFRVMIDGEEISIYQIERGTDSNAAGRSTLGYSRHSQRKYTFIRNDYGVALHELGHCIGFSHEHQRPDRDDYISIWWHNIMLNYIDNFYSLPLSSNTFVDVYDYDSIMHYSDTAFSRSRATTIHSFGHEIGQREHLSELDQLNAMCLYCTEYRSSNAMHYRENRATSDYRTIGSDEYLGRGDQVTTVREVRNNYYEVGTCCRAIRFGDDEPRRRFVIMSNDLYDGSVGNEVNLITGEVTSFEDGSQIVAGFEEDAAERCERYYQGILSFDLGEIPDDHRIVHMQLNARVFNKNGDTDDDFIEDLNDNLRIEFDSYFGDRLELEGYNDFGRYFPPDEFWFDPEIQVISDPVLPDIITMEPTPRATRNQLTWILIELRHDFPTPGSRIRIVQFRFISSIDYLVGIQGLLGAKPHLVVETVKM